MKYLKTRFWELSGTVLIVPALVCAVWNADLVRMALGAFGPPPGVVLLRWLGAGLLFVAFALWRRTRRRQTRSWWLVSLAGFALVAAATTALRDRDLHHRDVVFTGNGIEIAGTIYAPSSVGPFPAVVLVHGSPPIKRGFYAIWAEHIARAGFVVLVTDKRGVGGTGGVFNNQNNGSRANLTLLAGDVVAAITFLAVQPEVDSSRLGLFGVSQAGWVAPLAASMSSRVRYLALITAPTVSGHEESVWSDLRGDDARAAKVSRQQAESMMDTVSSGGVDARPLLKALNIPGIWMFGDEDNSVPTERSVRVLDSLRNHAERDYVAHRIAGAGHALFISSGGVVPRIAPASWSRLTEWLRANSGGRK